MYLKEMYIEEVYWIHLFNLYSAIA